MTELTPGELTKIVVCNMRKSEGCLKDLYIIFFEMDLNKLIMCCKFVLQIV